MALTITDIPDRQTIALDAEADFQPWTGIAADGNTLLFARKRSAFKRSWCAIDNAGRLRRLTQGLSFNGHFPTPGETLISTNQIPAAALRLDFDHPIIGIGLDVEPAPAAVAPGQVYKVRVEVTDTATNETASVEKVGAIGATRFVGLRADADRINRMVVRAVMVDGAGNETPVDFAINRLELLTPVGNIV